MKKLSIPVAALAIITGIMSGVQPAHSAALQTIADTTVVSFTVHVGHQPTHSATPSVTGGVGTAISIVSPHLGRSIGVSTRALALTGNPSQNIVLPCPIQVSINTQYMWTLDQTLTNDFHRWNFMASDLSYRLYEVGKPAVGPYHQMTAFPDNNNQPDPVARDYGNVHQRTYCVDLKLKIPAGVAGGDYYDAISYVLFVSHVGSRPTPTPTSAPTPTPVPTATPTPTPMSTPVSYVSTVLADRPGVYLRMNDTIADLGANNYIKDWSGNGYNAQIPGASYFSSIAGPIYYPSDSALSFGNGAYVTANYAPLVAGFSVESWVNTTDSSAPMFISSGPGGNCATNFEVALNDNGLASEGLPYAGRVAITFANPGGSWPSAGVVSTTTVNDGYWHHIVATWTAPAGSAVDSSQLRIYVDGIDKTGQSFAANGALGWSSPIPIDQWNGGSCLSPGTSSGNGYFNVSTNGTAPIALDEWAEYPYALTPAQVLSHYNVGKYGHT